MQDPKIALNAIFMKPSGAVDRVKNQLSYKLGKVILEARIIFKILKLPFRLISLIRKHHFEQRVLRIMIRLEPKFRPLDLEKYQDYEEALKVKKHLSYRLGSNLIKNPLTFLFKVKRIYEDFKNNKL